MSLSKLLAAGKSIMGVKEGNSPYRMNARNLLPKFGSTKNPFGAPKKVSAAGPPPAPTVEMETVSLFDHATAKNGDAPATPVAETYKAAPREIETPGVEPRAPEEVPAAGAATEPVAARRQTPAPELAIAGGANSSRRWAGVVNSLKNWAGHRPDPARGKSRSARAAVQSELSLENVRVVRNELNDSDLEVVPAKPVVIRDPAATESPPRDTILRGTTMHGTQVSEAVVFSPGEASPFGAGVLDIGNAR